MNSWREGESEFTVIRWRRTELKVMLVLSHGFVALACFTAGFLYG